jgi:hypothetical protein
MLSCWDSGLASVHALESLRQDRLSGHGTIDFMTAVVLGRARRTENPLDHIYGLLGFAEGKDERFREGIPIEYSSDALAFYWKVFALYGKIAITSRPGLGLLAYVSSKDRPDGLPSWCPNLNCEGKVVPMPYGYDAWPLPEDNADLNDMTQNIRTDSENPRALEIVGAQIDTIESVTRSVVNIQAFGPRLHKWLDECLHKTQAVYHSNHDELPEAFWRTLTGDIGVNRRFPCTDRDLYDYLTARRRLELGHGSGRFTDEEEAVASSWVDRYYFQWKNRAFFTTKGGQVGFGSIDVCPGDAICILYSGPTVYVLRSYPGKDAYQFVCDGYTHGLMKGEGLEMIKSGEVKTQRFALE